MLFESALVGRGWSHPGGVDPATAAITLVTDDDDIRQAIHLILMTRRGERSMRPDFGCDLDVYVFAPVSATTAGQISHSVRTSLERWEPRITVDDVAVSADEHEVGVLYIEIGYRIQNTNSTRNLVFPFYTIPQEPSAAGGQ
ncbi:MULTISPECIES: GPW/gp25 family protein [unclassified Streptomyces]|uniref:GPW/gp25 family protein n=1 Tax=unclassified Streptomyces TaxID=2593676 RepID=UPI00226F5C0B|nr:MULTISPECIES: GPW/gp25 family protein [unclassified Streptomyces]MCY0924099.1 GPW/gp25 family protein [Streptomyces sp. H27-G5]MCY0962361.1 GPW/gp25 family protein [Streptomyces sp. H27-H5]